MTDKALKPCPSDDKIKWALRVCEVHGALKYPGGHERAELCQAAVILADAYRRSSPDVDALEDRLENARLESRFNESCAKDYLLRAKSAEEKLSALAAENAALRNDVENALERLEDGEEETGKALFRRVIESESHFSAVSQAQREVVENAREVQAGAKEAFKPHGSIICHIAHDRLSKALNSQEIALAKVDAAKEGE